MNGLSDRVVNILWDVSDLIHNLREGSLSDKTRKKITAKKSKLKSMVGIQSTLIHDEFSMKLI